MNDIVVITVDENSAQTAVDAAAASQLALDKLLATSIGVAIPADVPAGTGFGYWLSVTPGPYLNHGGVVVNYGSLALILRSEAGAYSVSQSVLDITSKLNVSDVQNNLTSTSEVNPVSALQAKILNDKVEAVFVPINPNLFDKSTVVLGKFLLYNNTLADNAPYFTSDYISVSQLTQYKTNQVFTFIGFYDANKTMINYLAVADQTTINTVAGCEFIRFSENSEFGGYDSFKLESGTVSTTYTDYGAKGIEEYAKHGYASEAPKTVKEIDDKTKEYLDDNLITYNDYYENNAFFDPYFNGWLTNTDAIVTDGSIKEIIIKVGAVGDYLFAVGSIDQYNKVIIEKEFTVNIPVITKTTLAVDVTVKSGQHLFIKINSNVLFFDAAGVSSYGNILFSVSTTSALISLNSFGGMPFQFKVKNKSSMFAFKDDLNPIVNDVALLKNLSNANILKLISPNGGIYQLSVSNAGVLSAILSTYTKWVALGNSITIHPITSYWWGEWGMAASTRAKDWVHQLNTKIQGLNPIAPTFSAHNIGAWEQAHTTFDKNAFNSYFAGDEDLVVIRLGENVSDLTNYEMSFNNLITYVKSKAPLAKIIVTGNFWVNTNKDLAQKNASDSSGCTWVQLDYLDAPAYKATLGTMVYGDDNQWHTISDGGATAGGVAIHPGDVGMEAIADSIFSVI